jgi:hypothetical protein
MPIGSRINSDLRQLSTPISSYVDRVILHWLLIRLFLIRRYRLGNMIHMPIGRCHFAVVPDFLVWANDCADHIDNNKAPLTRWPGSLLLDTTYFKIFYTSCLFGFSILRPDHTGGWNRNESLPWETYHHIVTPATHIKLDDVVHTKSYQFSLQRPNLFVIPHSEKMEMKPLYVCPGCSYHTYCNNMINRCHVR